jgi:spore germination cell wall hydrolase CwlJ-like protein
MSREERKTNVPEDEVDEKMEDFRFSGATSVTKTRQPDGRFTIIAIFKDTPTSSPTTIIPNSGLNGGENSNAIDTLARTLWGEARGETKAGREAIASVVLNRLKRPSRFGETIEEVCRKPFQFSCWNDDDPNLPKLKKANERDPIFAECVAIAGNAVQGILIDSVIGADHYHTAGVTPDWSHGKVPCITIGNHLFFNNIT